MCRVTVNPAYISLLVLSILMVYSLQIHVKIFLLIRNSVDVYVLKIIFLISCLLLIVMIYQIHFLPLKGPCIFTVFHVGTNLKLQIGIPDSTTTSDLRRIPLAEHRQGCTLFTTFIQPRTIVVYWCAISWC